MLLLSLPALLSGSEPALIPFVPANAAPPQEEEAYTSEELAVELPPESLEGEPLPPAP